MYCICVCIDCICVCICMDYICMDLIIIRFIRIIRKKFYMSNISFFQCIYILLKTLPDNSFHLFFRTKSINITAKQV